MFKTELSHNKCKTYEYGFGKANQEYFELTPTVISRACKDPLTSMLVVIKPTRTSGKYVRDLLCAKDKEWQPTLMWGELGAAADLT